VELIIFLAIGSIAGFAAGIFGVGGGIIIVPLLYVVFTQIGYNPEIVMHLALGTSLATIMVTSISSLMAHHKKEAVLWPVFKNLAPGLIVGSFLGAGIAGLLARAHLQLIIGTFAIWVSYNMFSGAKKVVDQSKVLPSATQQVFAGTGIGVASAIFGIGGGSLTVPYLNYHGVIMQKAVGTSAACGLPIAIAGALGFMLFGLQEHAQVPNSIGFVHIYAFLGISSMSFFTAKSGAKTAHALSAAILKKYFSMMLFCVGCFFIVRGLL
jgi:uncharacterized membrane protein YfcA